MSSGIYYLQLIASCLFLVAAGCGQQDRITHYTVTKPELVDPTLVAAASAPVGEQQTIGLMVPVGDMCWFFKLTGPKGLVEPQHEAYSKFATSLKFSGGIDPKPSWTLPSGWKELPGRDQRFATLQITGSGAPLELSVIPLPNTSRDTEKYILDNVNRWRQQLKMAPIAASELATTTKSIEIDGHAATLVSLVGTGSGQMGGAPFAPFAGGAGAALPTDHPPVGKPSTDKAVEKPSGNAELKYEAPPEWTPGKPNAFSVAALKVVDGDKQCDITVSSAGGDLLSNVNRWRGQIRLPPVGTEELNSAVKSIETLGATGQYVELVGPSSGETSETILGVRAEAGDRTWFVKLKGDSQLAQREKPRFEAFVKSLQRP